MIRRCCPFMLFAALAILFAQPAFAQSLLERLEKKLTDVVPPGTLPPPKKPTADKPPPDPTPERGFLGITPADRKGVVEIVELRPGGPCDKAGLKPGDRITTIGGVDIKSVDEFGAIADELTVGAKIEIGFIRSGREEKVSVTTSARPGGIEIEDVPRDIPLEQSPATLGVRASPVSADLQRRYGFSARRGAVIESIVPGSPADRYGLRLGSVLVAVDGAAVDSPDDLAKHIGARRPGDTIELSYYVRDQVFRKKVRLVPDSEEIAPVAPGAGDRPILRRVERALEDIGSPKSEDATTVARLQAHIESLEAKIEEMEKRLKALEAPRAKPPFAEPTPDGSEPKLDPPLRPLKP